MRPVVRLLTSLLTAALAIAVVVGGGAPAAAQSSGLSGPTVSLDIYEIRPGDRVSVSMNGFRASTVTISVCGNDARRGSVDCNMTASRARELRPDGVPTIARMEVLAPPVPCPCIIRVSSTDNQEVAVVPVVIVGHPLGDPLAANPADLTLTASIDAVTSEAGVASRLASSLGGRTTYDVTVRVRNPTTVTIESVRISGTVGRDANDVIAALELDDPGDIGPGQTWEETVQVDLPAPVYGSVEWRMVATGAGPSVSASDATRHVPVVLYVLIAFLVLDLLLILLRLIRRAVGRRRAAADVEPAVDAGSAAHTEVVTDDVREPQPVG